MSCRPAGYVHPVLLTANLWLVLQVNALRQPARLISCCSMHCRWCTRSACAAGKDIIKACQAFCLAQVALVDPIPCCCTQTHCWGLSPRHHSCAAFAVGTSPAAAARKHIIKARQAVIGGCSPCFALAEASCLLLQASDTERALPHPCPAVASGTQGCLYHLAAFSWLTAVSCCCR